MLFAFDRADLRPQARRRLEQVAASIKEKAPDQATITIDGHTDAVGTDAYNRRLSLRRAQAVHDELVRLLAGKPVRFEVAGHGETRPVAPNTRPDGGDNPRGRAKNRRVTIRFAK